MPFLFQNNYKHCVINSTIGANLFVSHARFTLTIELYLKNSNDSDHISEEFLSSLDREIKISLKYRLHRT
jgi:hypothetical protein